MLTDAGRAVVESFLQAWGSGRRTRERLGSKVPIAEMQQAAVHHEDPWVRRSCLSFLDHHAADASAGVFLAALDDPVAPVRGQALHGLACEQCRTEELCVAEVTLKVVAILERDPNAEVRHTTIPILVRLAGRDHRAIAAVRGAAEHDHDLRVRQAAAAVLSGRRPRRWNQSRRSAAARRTKAARRPTPR